MLFEPFELKLKSLIGRIENAYLLSTKNNEFKLKKAEAALEALAPRHVLERGYSVAYKGNKPITNTSELVVGDDLKVRFANGTAEVKVLKILSE